MVDMTVRIDKSVNWVRIPPSQTLKNPATAPWATRIKSHKSIVSSHSHHVTKGLNERYAIR